MAVVATAMTYVLGQVGCYNRLSSHYSNEMAVVTTAMTAKLLGSNGITQSMSRKGNCYDNVITETFSIR